MDSSPAARWYRDNDFERDDVHDLADAYQPRHITEHEHDDDISLLQKTPTPHISHFEPESSPPTRLNRAATPRTGIRYFIAQNPALLIALACGIIGATACFVFTWWLSRQRFSCPSWSVDCNVSPQLGWLVNNLGLVQGIVSAISEASLASMAYVVYVFSEAALWPLLARREYKLRDLDVFLSTSRGSAASLPMALWTWKSPDGLVILLIVGLVTCLLKAESVIVGAAYTRQNVSTSYTSPYNIGGNTGVGFSQANPPTYMPAAMTLASSLYSSWAYGLSTEPLPTMRDFLVDRTNLSMIGNTTVGAIQMQRSYNCVGQSIQLLSTDEVSSEDYILQVSAATNTSVSIRMQAGMTTWVDDYELFAPTRAVANVVFAVLGGQLNGSTVTDLSDNDVMTSYGYSNISAVSCTVDITLVDSVMEMGDGITDIIPVNTSTLATISGPGGADSDVELSNVALWLATAVTRYGFNIYGAQPVFHKSVSQESYTFGPGVASLPVYFTSWGSAQLDDNVWNVDDLTSFLDVGAGAFAIAYSRQSYHDVAYITSEKDSLRLRTARSYIMLVPVALILGLLGLMVLITKWMNVRTRTPGMRLVQVRDVVRTTQTEEIRRAADAESDGGDAGKGLGQMWVRYGVSKTGQARLGTEASTSKFR